MRDKRGILLIFLTIILVVLTVTLTTVGSADLNIVDIISELFEEKNDLVRTIVFKMRLPRNILAIIVGANLAVSGLLLQAVMKNSLADPGITGVSSGASVGAIIILLVAPQYTKILPIVAFAGGVVACLLVYIMAWKKGLRPERIVLSGVAVNAILGGVISLLSVLYSERIQSAMMWLNGTLSNKSWSDVEMIGGYSVIGLILALLMIRKANILQLGDDVATNLGINVVKTRAIISAIAVFLAGISTAVVGIISFVGLIVPHIARMLMGTDHKYTIPFSIILGSIVLLLADALGRSIWGGVEIPVGVIMAIVGGPFFLYLLRKRGM